MAASSTGQGDVASEHTATSSGADDPVGVVDYDPTWPEAFAKEATRIVAAIGAQLLGIEHIGSTAVEGLAAKPVIDIQVGVRSLETSPDLVAAMATLGYSYLPGLEQWFPERRYFHKISGGRRTHQVHLVERADTAWWDRHVVFRDWLRSHPSDRDEYAALKRYLAARYRGERAAYTDAKTAFVNRIVAVAQDRTGR